MISDVASKQELQAAYQVACNTMHVMRIVLSQRDDALALELARALFHQTASVERLGPLGCTLRRLDGTRQVLELQGLPLPIIHQCEREDEALDAPSGNGV